MGEHLPYKQRVTGSSPVLSTRGIMRHEDRALYFPRKEAKLPQFTKNGLVAQLVRALACHARGRGFEPHPSRHFSQKLLLYADLAHLVERHLAKVEVAGSSPVIRSKRSRSSDLDFFFCVYLTMLYGSRTRACPSHIVLGYRLRKSAALPSRCLVGHRS